MNRRQRRLIEKGNRMALSRYLTRWVDVPHEPGERFQFRMPNWTIIEEARAERRRKMYGEMRETREVVGADMLTEWRKEQAETDAAAKAAKTVEADDETTAIAKVKTADDVLNEFDRLLLLTAGIGGWTYCEPLLDDDNNPLLNTDGKPIPDRTKPIKVSPDALRDLDEETQKWAGLTLVALVSSGFRPVMPVVRQDEHGNVIDIRPGVDSDPLAYSSSSNGTATAQRV